MDSSHSTQASHCADSSQPARSYPSPVIPVSPDSWSARITRIARSSPVGSVSLIVRIPVFVGVVVVGGVTRAAGVTPDTTDTTDMRVAGDLRVSPVVSVVPVLRVSPVVPDYAIVAVIPSLVALLIILASSALVIVRSVTFASPNRAVADTAVKRTVTKLLRRSDLTIVTVLMIVHLVTNRIRVPVSTALSAMSNSADLGIVAPTTFLPNPRTVADFSVSSILTVVSEKLFSTTARIFSLLPYVLIVPFMMIVPYLPKLPNLTLKPLVSVQSILTILLIPTTE